MLSRLPQLVDATFQYDAVGANGFPAARRIDGRR
jgi:hypothetical protein